MDRTEMIKVMLFDDSMDRLLLVREDVLSPFSGTILKADTLISAVSRIMAPHMGIDPTKQPVWYHLRSEEMSYSKLSVHIFFGRLPIVELLKVEKFNPRTMMLELEQLRNRQNTIAHRLRYLIPMALVLSSIDTRMWPRP